MATPVFFDTVSLIELQERGLEGATGPLSEVAADESTAKVSVLVVDDERVLADTLVLILNNKGFRARAAYSGEHALELARAAAPDILLSDVMMPGMNGMDLATAVRNSWPECRILLISGNAAALDMLRTHGYDFELLSKPIHPSVLVERLRAHCRDDEAA